MRFFFFFLCFLFLWPFFSLTIFSSLYLFPSSYPTSAPHTHTHTHTHTHLDKHTTHTHTHRGTHTHTHTHLALFCFQWRNNGRGINATLSNSSTPMTLACVTNQGARKHHGDGNGPTPPSTLCDTGGYERTRQTRKRGTCRRTHS